MAKIIKLIELWEPIGIYYSPPWDKSEDFYHVHHKKVKYYCEIDAKEPYEFTEEIKQVKAKYAEMEKVYQKEAEEKMEESRKKDEEMVKLYKEYWINIFHKITLGIFKKG